MMAAQEKVSAQHLARMAYLYVRQSTVRQVFENTESTVRQYALRERAIALGWPPERIVVVDSDLGQSAASAVDRAGFQTLVAEVGLGHVGIVLGLEVSRLARNNSDWHHLLEICALTETLILDEDGIYDPGHFNDRLLLGLKGTMSEAELHVLHARLRGGILSKARRGELPIPLPIGFVRTENGTVVLDPDAQIQHAVRLFFATFARTGSAWTTVKVFREQGLLFPRRLHSGPHKGEVLWAPLLHSTCLHLLHNPRYAGASFFGRTRQHKLGDGRVRSRLLPQDHWLALHQNAHAGYISWADFEQNRARLLENAQACGQDRRHGPPREGPALLQGLVLCGRCGERMTVRYHRHHAQLMPSYLCQRVGIEHGDHLCQVVPGARLDQLIGELLVATMTPASVEVALAVQAEVAQDVENTDRLRLLQVERARYDADLAARRFRQVDPDNRLVAAVLEAEWNEQLRLLTEAQATYDQQCQADRQQISAHDRAALVELTADFARLWRDPHTPDRERKRIARLLLADVTITKQDDHILAQVRFVGGATRTLQVPLSHDSSQFHTTDPAIVAQIDDLLDQYTDAGVAQVLNERGLQTFTGRPFTATRITSLRKRCHLRDRYTRLRAAGLLTRREMAAILGISTATVPVWRDQGTLRAYTYNDQGACLYEPTGNCPPQKYITRYRTRRILQQQHVGGAV